MISMLVCCAAAISVALWAAHPTRKLDETSHDGHERILDRPPGSQEFFEPRRRVLRHVLALHQEILNHGATNAGMAGETERIAADLEQCGVAPLVDRKHLRVVRRNGTVTHVDDIRVAFRQEPVESIVSHPPSLANREREGRHLGTPLRRDGQNLRAGPDPDHGLLEHQANASEPHFGLERRQRAVRRGRAPRAAAKQDETIAEQVAIRQIATSREGARIAEADAAVLRVLLRGEFAISGLTARAIRKLLSDKTRGQISRLLKRLRVHGVLRKVGRHYKYYLTDLGREVATMTLKLRELYVIPALAY